MNDWISVEEKLPPEKEFVKIKRKHRVYRADLFLCKNDAPFWTTDNGKCFISGVTHWMPVDED